MVCVSVVLGVVSHLSKLWRNDHGYTGKQKNFEQDFLGLFVYTKNGIYIILEADVMSCVQGVT